MRISDWSSDVCSSDLFEAGIDLDCVFIGEARAGLLKLIADTVHEHFLADPGTATGVAPGWHHRRRIEGDRKSVVSGKSVSVRVDLGGRRIIKKKNKIQ